VRLLLVSATEFELAGVGEALNILPNQVAGNQEEGSKISWLVHGVGMVETAFSLGQHFAKNQYDLIIQAGIAGAIDRSIELGSVVEIQSDCFGGFGAEHQDESIESVFDLGLISKGGIYNSSGFIKNQRQPIEDLRQCIGITVQAAHGSEPSINRMKVEHPSCQVESMEGAAFLMSCKRAGQAGVQLRAISNYVEPRNRDAWKIQEALDSLNKYLIEYIKTLSSNFAQ